MSAPELKPCPFCGGEAASLEDGSHSTAWEIGCYNGQCAAEPHVWEATKEKAIAAWNRRADLPPTDAEVMAYHTVKALVEALRGLVPILCENEEDGCGKLSRHDCAACEGYAAIAALERK